jgi:hypothetical protein
MISPVNSDKTINTSTEQSGRSNPSQKTAAATEQIPNRQHQTVEPHDSTLEIDQARRLFDMENNRIQRAESGLENPQQARTLLQSIVQQIAGSPEEAAKAQAGKASAALSSLLQSAPA